MKSYEEINAKIESKKAVVLTAEEIIGYVEKKGLAAATREVDVVTTGHLRPHVLLGVLPELRAHPSRACA